MVVPMQMARLSSRSAPSVCLSHPHYAGIEVGLDMGLSVPLENFDYKFQVPDQAGTVSLTSLVRLTPRR